MIGYANQVLIIFLNINLYVGNERKMVIKLNTNKITHIVAAYIPILIQKSLCKIIIFLNLLILM